MSTGSLGPHNARIYSRASAFWLVQRSLRMRRCGRMGESWEDSKLSRRCSWMWTDFVSHHCPLRNHSISSPFFLAFGINALLFTAQADLMDDCILKVTLGKRAGISASRMALSSLRKHWVGRFVGFLSEIRALRTTADRKAPKQEWNASRAASVPACLMSQRARDSQKWMVQISRIRITQPWFTLPVSTCIIIFPTPHFICIAFNFKEYVRVTRLPTSLRRSLRIIVSEVLSASVINIWLWFDQTEALLSSWPFSRQINSDSSWRATPQQGGNPVTGSLPVGISIFSATVALASRCTATNNVHGLKLA